MVAQCSAPIPGAKGFLRAGGRLVTRSFLFTHEYIWLDHSVRAAPPGNPDLWVGSLVKNKRDLTGNLYMRNRYYDAQAGRFSQEDPIGLAGGLNAYGFAAGDPVSYSDPYGLCPPEDDNFGPECFGGGGGFGGSGASGSWGELGAGDPAAAANQEPTPASAQAGVATGVLEAALGAAEDFKLVYDPKDRGGWKTDKYHSFPRHMDAGIILVGDQTRGPDGYTLVHCSRTAGWSNRALRSRRCSLEYW